MKSRGKNLHSFDQAKGYLQKVPQQELPKYILVSDFDIFRLTDLEEDRPTTRKLADIPALIGEVRQPMSEYLPVPGVSSENRKFILIGYLKKEVIASDLVRTVPNATLYHIGILTSTMHMAWVRISVVAIKATIAILQVLSTTTILGLRAQMKSKKQQ